MGSCINDSQWKIGAFLTNSYANPKKFRSRKKKIHFGLNQQPDCVVIPNPDRKSSVILEANRLQIPIASLVDSTIPWQSYKRITYPIPANDTRQFMYLFLNSITKTVIAILERPRITPVNTRAKILSMNSLLSQPIRPPLLPQLRRNYGKRRGEWEGVLSLRHIVDNWKEITGKPADSCSWLKQLKSYATWKKWTTPNSLLETFPLEEIVKRKKDKQIEDVFMFVKDPKDKQSIAKWLEEQGIQKKTIHALELTPDLNKEPPEEAEPARERGDGERDQPARQDHLEMPPEEPEPARDQLDPNKKLPLPFDLNDVGDDGGWE